MSTRHSQPRALGWEVLSGLMSGNDYERFPNWFEEIFLKFGTPPALAPVHSALFFQQFCSLHFEKSGTHEYKVFTA